MQGLDSMTYTWWASLESNTVPTDYDFASKTVCLGQLTESKHWLGEVIQYNESIG